MSRARIRSPTGLFFFPGFDSFYALQTIRRTLAKNLRTFIKARGYRTLELFAHENNFEKGTIAKIARGAVAVKFETIVRIARALGVTLEDLYPMKRK